MISQLLLAALTLCVAPQSRTEVVTMKAVRIHAFGGVEQLKHEDAEKPVPGAGEVLVRVQAAGVNPVDWKAREGLLKSLAPKLPQVLGYDVAGKVEALGPGTEGVKVGDAVCAYLSLSRGGGYAEFALVRVDELALAPKKASVTEAAGLPLAGLTAWQALVDEAELGPGQRVLIHGGAGGVGHLAVQLAKARGAFVYATAGTQNQAFLKELGVDRPIDYTTERFEEIATDVDVVLDTIGGETAQRSYSLVKRGGTYVSIVGPPDVTSLAERGVNGRAILVQPNGEQLAELVKLVDEKKLKVAVSATLPLAEARRAHELSAKGHVRGKLVLSVAP
ncbi:MAG: NADP-dependent oxidoreductase [Planctomycetes bacterium]|nr:NADP-dependent oxidoreductase [Planctomycetota bacterium]